MHSEELIFLKALELESDKERRAFLRRACEGDPKRLADIESLLLAHEVSGDLLEVPERQPQTLSRVDDGPSPGDFVGAYRLEKEIAEGGMGVVFLAQQDQPLARRVALKIIKPEMCTREIIGRFESERQALALMDHPNIASVFDAGTCDSGLPYFVMELVSGAPITVYCDEHRLTVPERLKLFVEVCYAVEHAHQKGIIHRDLKPANLLISQQQTGPLAKVIDFGVATAADAALSADVRDVRHPRVVGTPLYMSPEQTRVDQQDVDTRADIYSLGIILYELLSGATPFDCSRFDQVSFKDVREIIGFEPLPPPSRRLSLFAGDAERIAACRRTTLAKLSKQLSRDLDWIVMRAVHKDRSRRYQTAISMAEDIGRYVDGLAVEAHPPSAAYRAKKTISRNRVSLSATVAVVIALAIGLGIAQFNFRKATLLNTRLTATLSQLEDSMYDQGINHALSGNYEKAGEFADRLTQLRKGERALHISSLSLLVQERWEESIAQLESANRDGKESVARAALLTSAYGGSGDLERWFIHIERLQELQTSSDYDRLLKAIAILSMDPAQARSILDSVVASRRSPIALLFRGRASATYAQHAGRRELIRPSLDDVMQAQAWLPTEGVAGWIVLETYLRAARLAARFGRADRHQQILRDAEGVVGELQSREDRSVWDSVYLAKYYYECNQPRRALSEYHLAASMHGSDLAVRHYLCLAHELETAPDAGIVNRLRIEPPGPYSELAWAFIQASEGNVNDAREVGLRIVESARTLDVGLTGLMLLHFTGDVDEAQAVAVQLSDGWQSKNLDCWSCWLLDNALPFYLSDGGERAEADLLRRAEGSDYSARWLTLAHSQIAAKRMGCGDRDAAIASMQACVDQRLIDGFDSLWWRATLATMGQP